MENKAAGGSHGMFPTSDHSIPHDIGSRYSEVIRVQQSVGKAGCLLLESK